MHQTTPVIEYVHKIAIVRANALGDFIVTLPAIDAIRHTYPHAETVLLGRPWHQAFLKNGRNAIDRVIVVPRIKGVRDEQPYASPAEVDTFIRQMQEENFDIVINFQGDGKSVNPLITRFNAAYTVGCVGTGVVPLNRSIPFYYYQSEVVRYLEVAQLIGAHTFSLQEHVNALPEDQEEIKPLLRSLQGKAFVVLHTIAEDYRRMWPLENYPTLADQLSEKNLAVVFTGAGQDFPWVEQIISSMKSHAFNTCGQFSLGGLTALLSHAAVVMGADTGPLHLARAVGTPTVGVHWAPNLINWGPVTRATHHPVISWNMHCPLCGEVPNQPVPFLPQHHCKHEVSFVRDIPVEAVMHAMNQLLHKKTLHASFDQSISA